MLLVHLLLLDAGRPSGTFPAAATASLCAWGWGADVLFDACVLCRQAPGKYTVVLGEEKESPEALAVRSGDVVEVVQEGDEGLW